jgi:hypothetical protein
MHNWKTLQTAPYTYLVWLKAQFGTRLYSHVALADECQVTRNLTERDKRMDISVGQDAVRKLWLLRCEIQVVQPAYQTQGHTGVCPVTPPLLRTQVPTDVR